MMRCCCCCHCCRCCCCHCNCPRSCSQPRANSKCPQYLPCCWLKKGITSPRPVSTNMTSGTKQVRWLGQNRHNTSRLEGLAADTAFLHRIHLLLMLFDHIQYSHWFFSIKTSVVSEIFTFQKWSCSRWDRKVIYIYTHAWSFAQLHGSTKTKKEHFNEVLELHDQEFYWYQHIHIFSTKKKGRCCQ